jgi:hypothetical protein
LTLNVQVLPVQSLSHGSFGIRTITRTRRAETREGVEV